MTLRRSIERAQAPPEYPTQIRKLSLVAGEKFGLQMAVAAPRD